MLATSVSEELKADAQLVQAMRRELRSCCELWVSHQEMLSRMDELAIAAVPLRGASPAEAAVVHTMTKDERRCLVLPGELTTLELENAAEATGSWAALDDALHQLKYLKRVAAQETGEEVECAWDDDNGTCEVTLAAHLTAPATEPERGRAEDECPVCHGEVSGMRRRMLGCGHWFCEDCVQHLARGRGGNTFPCPTCRRRNSLDTSVFRAVDLPDTDGTEPALPVKGSWGTKISAIVSDVLALRGPAPSPEGDAHDAGPPETGEASPQKALVFSHWEEMLDLTCRALEDNGVRTVRLKGARSFKAAVQAFQGDPSIAVLALPLKLGANGLNLVEARHVFLCEPILNPKLEEQAIGRVHRIGQRFKTTVHHYVIAGTVEDRITSLRAHLARHGDGAADAPAAEPAPDELATTLVAETDARRDGGRFSEVGTMSLQAIHALINSSVG